MCKRDRLTRKRQELVNKIEIKFDHVTKLYKHFELNWLLQTLPYVILDLLHRKYGGDIYDFDYDTYSIKDLTDAHLCLEKLIINVI